MLKLPKLLKRPVIKFLRALAPGLEHRLRSQMNPNVAEDWLARTRLVQESADNAYLTRVPGAGEVHEGVQLMHNGLKVVAGSYYGTGITELLRANGGVHEPQEERVFAEVLPHVSPGSTMVELGAYWGFYSMWFCLSVPQARAFLVEPELVNLEFGRKNFALNGLTGDFTQAFVGSRSRAVGDEVPILCVDDFVRERRVQQIAILHSDIQGFELEMLKGSRRSMSAGLVDFVFISTHSAQLHEECSEYLTRFGFVILASAFPAESYSVDGILVARAAHAPILPPIPISKRSPAH